ncbi:MAG: RNA polymerase sigma factor [Cytophagaceae bacterium]
MTDLDQILSGCKNNNPKAQQLLYSRFAYKTMGICLRYCKSRMEAEDVLQEAFIKIFQKISEFRGDGSLEGWVKRIVVTTAINYYHANKKRNADANIEDYPETAFEQNEAISNLSSEELLALVGQLPEGYKMVLNLYAIEGYAHKEIAEMLGISEGTSKSQLSRARSMLAGFMVKKKAMMYAGR